ncbi:MAG: SDR family NAD(P)-dependent oxidoreductase [bacterium]
MAILDDFRIDGRVAIVTGAGRGIGQGVAKVYGEAKAKVVVADLDEGPAKETLEMVKAAGGEGVVVTGDVSKKADVEKIVKTALDTYGGLDIMANIAGITRDGMAHKMTEDMWDFIIGVNLKGTFFCCQAALNAMRDLAKKEGKEPKSRKIVNISSIAGLYGNKGQANYSAAKSGIIGLTKTMAIEGLMFRIGCNCVAPGWVDTRLTREKKEGEVIGIPAQDRQMSLMFMNAMNIRIGVPLDLARVVYFLSCDASDYVVGQTINVSGGLRV